MLGLVGVGVLWRLLEAAPTPGVFNRLCVGVFDLPAFNKGFLSTPIAGLNPDGVFDLHRGVGVFARPDSPTTAAVAGL